MKIEITQDDAKFLLEAIAQKPVQTNIDQVIAGISVAPNITKLIAELQLIIKTMSEEIVEEVVETPVAEEAVAAEVTPEAPVEAEVVA